MQLTLKIVRHLSIPLTQITNKSHCFNQQGGTVGRSDLCDWVLTDENRLLSSTHMVVEYRDEHYYLTDISLNGVFVNKSKTALGRGNQVLLNSGDNVRISDFELLATMSEATLVGGVIKPKEKTSLYEKYGGFSTVSVLVADFYSRIQRSRRLRHFFIDVNMQRLANHQTLFLAHSLGGPTANITPESMAAAHQHLNIQPEDFDEVVELLEETLEDNQVEDDDIKTILVRVSRFRPQILRGAS